MNTGVSRRILWSQILIQCFCNGTWDSEQLTGGAPRQYSCCWTTLSSDVLDDCRPLQQSCLFPWGYFSHHREDPRNTVYLRLRASPPIIPSLSQPFPTPHLLITQTGNISMMAIFSIWVSDYHLSHSSCSSPQAPNPNHSQTPLISSNPLFFLPVHCPS